MKKYFTVLSLAFVLSAGLAACSKKQTVSPEASDAGNEIVTDAAIDSGKADSDSGNAMGLQTIFFPFDSADISGEGQAALDNNLHVLKENAQLKVQVEGHCDERGGIQYNLGLGERRAATVKQALVRGGIASARIATISFGKERPLVPGSNEDAWAKNRRGNFVITAK